MMREPGKGQETETLLSVSLIRTPSTLAAGSEDGIFDYGTLSEETRQFVEHKAEETHRYVRQTAEGIVNIGLNLIAVKERLGHGLFMTWVQTEFGFSRQSAQNYMNVARRFGAILPNFGNISVSVLYELLSAPQEVVEQVETGEIPATLSAVRAAKEAERVARLEAEASKAELQQAERALADLNQQLARLQEELTQAHEQAGTPSVQIHEVVPLAVSARLEDLSQQVVALTGQRDALSRQVAALGEQARNATLERNQSGQWQERGARIREQWRVISSQAERSLTHLLAAWPSPLDSTIFSAEEWDQLSALQAVAHRVMGACEALQQAQARTVNAAADGGVIS